MSRRPGALHGSGTDIRLNRNADLAVSIPARSAKGGKNLRLEGEIRSVAKPWLVKCSLDADPRRPPKKSAPASLNLICVALHDEGTHLGVFGNADGGMTMRGKLRAHQIARMNERWRPGSAERRRPRGAAVEPNAWHARKTHSNTTREPKLWSS
jgi:hypothetical protein